MHAAVVKAKDEAIAALRVGTTGDAVHQATIASITGSGYVMGLPPADADDGFISMRHGTGHGIGLDVHEPILLSDWRWRNHGQRGIHRGAGPVLGQVRRSACRGHGCGHNSRAEKPQLACPITSTGGRGGCPCCPLRQAWSKRILALNRWLAFRRLRRSQELS